MLIFKGSIEAISKLEENGVKCKYVTNESQSTRADLHAKLLRLNLIGTYVIFFRKNYSIIDITILDLSLIVIIEKEKGILDILFN